MNQRVIVIGASAGGVTALQAVVRTLPASLSAPVLVAMHVSPTHTSLLSDILTAAGALPAGAAEHGQKPVPRRIYVAPPDRHLLIAGGRLLVSHGPKENGFRPSVDVLFRSAAYEYGARAIGVVLTGSLADGSSGLHAIGRLGGTTIVQDPDDAAYSSMPLSAMRRVEIDHALPAADMGLLLAQLGSAAAGPQPLDVDQYRAELKIELQPFYSEGT